MTRFFIEPEQIRGDLIEVTGEGYHHLARVCRLAAGNRFTCVDGSGLRYLAQVDTVGSRMLRATVLERIPIAVEPISAVNLYLGMLKGDHFDQVVRKGTELGMARLVPLETARCNIPGKKLAPSRISRWRRIAALAAGQSGRTRIPEISPPLTLGQALRSGSSARRIVLVEESTPETLSLGRALNDSPDGPWSIKNAATIPQVDLFLGPEGGWDAEELLLATGAGLVPVSLGPRILRAETAAITALVLTLYILGELGTST